MIEKIIHKKKLLALIVRGTYRKKAVPIGRKLQLTLRHFSEAQRATVEAAAS